MTGGLFGGGKAPVPAAGAPTPPARVDLGDGLRIALHRGTSAVSRAIQWQTRSAYSHASIVCAGGWLFEAREGRLTGCERRLSDCAEPVDVFGVLTSAEARERVAAFLEEQRGKPYDWTMVARFVSRQQESRRSSGAWFCSELVYAACLHAGIPLLRTSEPEPVEPWRVSPGTLAMSPLLHHIATHHARA